MKILAGHRGDAGSYYRIQMPFRVLAYQGLEVEVRPVTVAAVESGEYDVLWLYQHADAGAEIAARSMRDQGGLVIYDVDDWLFEYPQSWIGYRDYFDIQTGQYGPRLRFHQRLLQLADAVTTTTPYLASNLRQVVPEETNIHVLPNCILMGDWDASPPPPEFLRRPVLGWFGTPNHWDDWLEIAGAVDAALQAVDGYLVLMGAPGILPALPETLQARTMVHPWEPDFHTLRSFIRGCDVGLVWATDKLEASRCRSPLKALQWGAAGVPLLASETVYGEVDGFADRYGFMVRSPIELAGAIVQAFTEHRGVLQARARAWQREVYLSHSYEVNAGMWANVVELEMSRNKVAEGTW